MRQAIIWRDNLKQAYQVTQRARARTRVTFGSCPAWAALHEKRRKRREKRKQMIFPFLNKITREKEEKRVEKTTLGLITHPASLMEGTQPALHDNGNCCML